MQVAINVLQFLNELISINVKAVGNSALLGLVSAVAKYAANSGPLGGTLSQDTRLQAAFFLQFLAQTNLLTTQLLLTCQVRLTLACHPGASHSHSMGATSFYWKTLCVKPPSQHLRICSTCF